MIHIVVGTRAQLFKMAPIMLECERRGLAWRWVYTAQHRDTIRESIETFGLPDPAVVVVDWETEAKSMGKIWRWFGAMVLSLPRSRRTLARFTGRRHIVLTHGDTLTTWLAALMGKLTRTPVMHVESGLRSFNLRNPFPEELNRLITFRLADYYACPGEWAVKNLVRYNGVKLDTRMNTQVDTLRFGLAHAHQASLDVPRGKYVVASLHRYENIFDRERFIRIVGELETIAEHFCVLFIQHPATELQIRKFGLLERLEDNSRIRLLPRLEYLPFINAVRSAAFVVTDGGGNQEELSYLGKPTLIFRDGTERQEGLGDNAALSTLQPGDTTRFMRQYESFRRPVRVPEFSPSAAIVDFLEERGFGAALR